MAPRSPGSAAQLAGWIGPLACACFAFLTHTLPFRARVFQPFGLVLFGDGDAYYHLRRIRAIAEHWPVVPDFDRYLNFPDGAYGIFAPAFDFVPATIARLGLPLETVAAYWPALLSALCCLPFYAYCQRRFGTLAAVSSCLVLAIMPANVLVGALGRIDHHIAELLFQLLIYAQLQRCFVRYGEGLEIARRDWLWLGLSMGGALMTWSGSLIVLAVPAAVGVVLNLLVPGPSTLRASRVIAAALLTAALLALPYGVLNCVRGRQPFSPNFPSLLQSSACFIMAMVVHGAALLRSSERQARSRELAITGAALLLLLCLPGVARGLFQGLAFLSGEQTQWLSTISEVRPLWSSRESFQQAYREVGFLVLLIPLAISSQVICLVRERRCSASDLLLLVWSGQTFALGLLQIRFLHYTVPIIAMVPWWLYGLSRRPMERLASVLIGLSLLQPASAFFAPLAHGQMVSYPQYRADLFELLREIPSRTPPIDDPEHPAYCIFAEWDVGHVIIEVAQRPVVANNFGAHLQGDSYADSKAFFQDIQGEAGALAIVERRGCRYVLTPARSPLVAAPAQPTFARRVHDADGSDSISSSGSGRLRLISETLGPPVSDQPAYKLFEVVRGAVLNVSTDNGELWAETHLKGSTRELWYKRKLTPAAEGGTQETRVAYPGTYRLLRDGEPVFSLQVSNDAVIQGRTIKLRQHAAD